MKILSTLIVLAAVLNISCTKEKEVKNEIPIMKDAHSYAIPEESKVTHLDWSAKIDFENKVISATATYELENAENAKTLTLDTRDLSISEVLVDEKNVEFTMGKSDPILGTPLYIPIDSKSRKVKITYTTTPHAAALQWLDPQQTAGKEFPFLFTQSQAILARTWIPCQDSPGIRFTYNAKVEVPNDLMAVMSARNPTKTHPSGVYEFVMPQTVPAYLMALSVGHLEFQSVGARTGVYAEPEMLKASAYEFEDMEKMLEAAENLYGKYAWERYDIIVLPPSFPFGGMENPRLTFATPTIIAGDKSLTALVAHELAHSWSGNVVTNATWDDFWLNEGFTVYFELRIMEAIYGKDYADMLTVLGYQGLLETVEDLGSESADTHLKLSLNGRDPDEGMNDIAYEKGSFFLRTIENAVGREKFDTFLKSYFETFGFKPMTTEIFMEYLEKELLNTPELIAQVRPDEWVYRAGIPDNIVLPKSGRFDSVNVEFQKWQSGTEPQELNTKNWSTHEWLHFLRQLPDSIGTEKMISLDKAFGFSKSGNSEILGIWLVQSVKEKYQPAYPALENFLVNVGRRKFLTPIYKEMVKDEEMKAMAIGIYQKARPNYHSVAYLSIDQILDPNEN